MPAASYPNFAGKHGHEAVFSPAEVVASRTANSTVPIPDAVILTYQRFLLDELKARGAQLATGLPTRGFGVGPPRPGATSTSCR